MSSLLEYAVLGRRGNFSEHPEIRVQTGVRFDVEAAVHLSVATAREAFLVLR